MGAGVPMIIGAVASGLLYMTEELLVQRHISTVVEGLLSGADTTVTQCRRLLDRSDLSPEERARARSLCASEVFRTSGERIQFRTEEGASVKYEPTKEDVDAWKVRLDLKAMGGSSGATLAFWIAVFAASAAIGQLTPVDRHRDTMLARLVQRNIDWAFQPREDGTAIFRPLGSFGTGYVLSTTEDEETLRQWTRRCQLAGFWCWPLLLLVYAAPKLLLFTIMPGYVAALLPSIFLLASCLCGVLVWQRSARRLTKDFQPVPPKFAAAPGLQRAAERVSRRALTVHASGGVAAATAALVCLIWQYRVLGTWQTLGLATVVVAGLCYYLWCRLIMRTKDGNSR
jgi:hypothetical protein